MPRIASFGSGHFLPPHYSSVIPSQYMGLTPSGALTRCPANGRGSSRPLAGPSRYPNFAQRGEIVESQVSTFWSNVITRWVQKVESNHIPLCHFTYRKLILTFKSQRTLSVLFTHIINPLNYQVIEHHLGSFPLTLLSAM
jgi:hypothetical protein